MPTLPFPRQLLELSRVLATAPDHEAFLSRSTQFLTTTFEPDRILWSDIDLSAGRVRGRFGSEEDLPIDFADQLLHRATGHPVINSYLVDPLDLTPRRLSDVMPDRVWLDSELYRDLFAAEGGRHQLSLVVELRAGRGIGWSLFREGRDFTEDQLEQAQLVLPMLSGFHHMYDRLAPTPPPAPLTSDLTPREHQVVRLLAEGLTATAIGRRLTIRPTTVRKHLEHIYAKFGVHDRVLVVNRARAMGLLTEPDPRNGAITIAPTAGLESL